MTDEAAAPAPVRSATRNRARTALEIGAAFAGTTLAVAILWHLPVAKVRDNLHALVGVMFLIVPFLALRGRGEIEAYGFTLRPVGLSLKLTALLVFVGLPLFVVGFVLWTRFACAHLPALVPASCAHALHPSLRWPPDLLTRAAAQLIVVALPEELFFRGYVQGRLEDAWPPRWRLFGAPLGGAWLLASLLFGAGHFLVSFEPQMLTRVFPGLVFGWLFARTRSLVAPTLFHAACNILMDVLTTSFYA